MEGGGGLNTVGVPDIAEKLHRRRRQRIVLGKLELGGEDAALKGRALGALDQALPAQDVVLGHGAGGDALGRVVGEGAVLLEQAALGGRLRHGGRGGRKRFRSVDSSQRKGVSRVATLYFKLKRRKNKDDKDLMSTINVFFRERVGIYWWRFGS